MGIDRGEGVSPSWYYSYTLKVTTGARRPRPYQLNSVATELLQREAVKETDVIFDGLTDFVEADVFIGCVGAGGVAGTHFERRPRHQCLVGKRGGAERFEAKHLRALYEWMADGYARRVKTRGAGSKFALGDGCTYQFESLGIAVGIGSTHIDHERTQVGHHIVLRPGINLGH